MSKPGVVVHICNLNFIGGHIMSEAGDLRLAWVKNARPYLEKQKEKN
jgi:hypothetical protein